MLCCIVLCIALYCIALHCIALHCIVLYCIVLYCVVLYCIVLYCIALCNIGGPHIVSTRGNRANKRQKDFNVVMVLFRKSANVLRKIKAIVTNKLIVVQIEKRSHVKRNSMYAHAHTHARTQARTHIHTWVNIQ